MGLTAKFDHQAKDKCIFKKSENFRNFKVVVDPNQKFFGFFFVFWSIFCCIFGHFWWINLMACLLVLVYMNPNPGDNFWSRKAQEFLHETEDATFNAEWNCLSIQLFLDTSFMPKMSAPAHKIDLLLIHYFSLVDKKFFFDYCTNCSLLLYR